MGEPACSRWNDAICMPWRGVSRSGALTVWASEHGVGLLNLVSVPPWVAVVLSVVLLDLAS